MKNFADILLSTQSDKESLHGYGAKYHALLSPFRLKPVNVIEFGFLGGDGLNALAEFFPHPKTRIVGVDIHDRGYRPKDTRIELYFGDASKKETTDRIPGEFMAASEDGSHMASHQIDTFMHFWPRIVPGGIWITEDLHSCHSMQHRDCHQTMIQFLGQVAENMQDPAGATGSAKYNPEHPWSDIASIELSKGLAIIRKRL